jgi:peptidoglycan/LPS O-acetylase OafA/YrhL
VRVTDYRRSGAVILLAALAPPVWGVPLYPTSLTVGRALIGLAAVLLAIDWLAAPRPRARMAGAVWLLIAAVVALWVWTAANAAIWGCGTCGGELAGFTELAAVSILAALIAALEPGVRPALVLAVLAGAALEAVLALAGVDGLWSGTINSSSVQSRLAGTFGNPNALGIALAFAIPAGLAALPLQRPRLRLPAALTLALVSATIVLTLSRSAILAAAAGAAVVIVLAQPPRSRARRVAVGGLAAAAVAGAVAYPVYSDVRQQAESRPIDPTLRARDTSGWDATRLGMVQVGGAELANRARDELRVRTPRAGHGVSHAIGTAVANGRYDVSFDARSVSGTQRLDFGLQDGISLTGSATEQARISERWRRLHVRWKPTGKSPYARLSVWSTAPSTGFLLRDVRLAARPPGAAAASRSTIDVRLKGSVYAQLLAQQRAEQKRDIASRRFAVDTSLSAFASQPLRGIGWGRFVDYSAAHGDYGRLPTHNEYLRILAELGAVGVLLLVLLGVVIARALWQGPRDEVGLAVLGMLVTGVVALTFINGLVAPYVTLPLGFAAALACARAGQRAPVRADGWWPADFSLRAELGRWRSIDLLRIRLPELPDWDAVRRAAPQPRALAPALPAVRAPAIRRLAPSLRQAPELALPDLGRTAPQVRELAGVPLPDLERPAPVARELPPAPLPDVKLPAPKLPALRVPPAIRRLMPTRPTRPSRRRLLVPRPVPAGTASRTAAPSPLRHRPALDGIRAVSLVAIIVYHATEKLPGGFIAVDIFFVLSGYLITSILVREHAAIGRVRLGRFWARRARRLLPAVMVLVLVCAIEIHRSDEISTWALRQSDLLSTLFYYANWHFIATDESYFAGFLGASPVRHTWTLAIEEQFYIVWPLLVLCAYRLLRGRGLMVVVVAGTFASALAMALLYDPQNPSRAYFGTDTRANALLVGAALALLLHHRPQCLTSARALTLARWAGAPVAIAVLVAFALASDQGAGYYQGGALAFELVVALGLFVVEAHPRGWLGRALSFGPLAWIGVISYGLYLWHWPVIVWMGDTMPNHGHLRKVVELVVMLAAACVSYYVVERPIRSGRFPGVGGSPRRLAVVLSIALAVVAVASVKLTTLDGSRALAQQLAPVTPLQCQNQLVVGEHAWCPRRTGKAGSPVVASIGDSTAQALYPGLRDAARQRDWTYIEAAQGGCSALPLLFVGADTTQDVAQARQCATDVAGIIKDVQARYRPEVWVLADRWPLGTLVTKDGTALAPTDPRRSRPIEAALRSLLERLTAGGARVVLVPTPPPGQPVDCALREPAPPLCANPAYSDRDPATARLATTIRRVVAGMRDKVARVSVDDVVCPDSGRCPARIDGTIVRYDSVHYSAAFSRKLVPVILARAEHRGVPLAAGDG